MSDITVQTRGDEVRKNYKVLLVDDDEFLISMYNHKFTQEGDETRSCLSVADALETLHGGFQPDVIAFDVVMPQQNGFDFLQTLKAEHLAEGACLIALTNQWEDENRSTAAEFGVDAYIIKAESVPSEIVKKIHEILAHRTPSVVKA